MIRFSCPVCDAKYVVDDAKGGKTGTCPKCKSQFVIPPGETPPAPPPVDPNAPVPVSPCPGCWSPLQVSREDIGAEIECPHCATVFTATAVDAQGKPLAVQPRKSQTPSSQRSSDRPSKRRDMDDEEGDDDRPLSRRDDDEEDDDRPRKKKKKKKRYQEESKRVTAALLAIFFGKLGIHKFYLGKTTAGIIHILLCFGMGGLINIIEAIIYLTKTDEEFIEEYQLGDKNWF